MRRLPTRPTAAVLTTALVLVAALAPGRADVTKDIQDKDVLKRLEAVEALVEQRHEDAVPLLVEALEDDDWEVVERAAGGLAALDAAEAIDPLVDVAVKAPSRRIRLAAARALATIDADAGAAGVTDLWKKKFGDAPAQALAEIARISGTPVARDGVEKGLKAKSWDVQEAAARGLAAFEPATRVVMLEELLGELDNRKDVNLALPCAALGGVIEAPIPEYLPVLVRLASRPTVPEVVERRTRAALRAVVLSAEDPAEAARIVIGEFDGAAGDIAVRGARTLGELARPEGDEDERAIPAAMLLPSLQVLAEHEDAAVRAAAVRALERVATVEALDLVDQRAKTDESPRVRFLAVKMLRRARGASHEGALRTFIDRLSYDEDVLVREEAAVALGAKGVTEATEALEAALRWSQDDLEHRWALGVVSAVSLGKTEDPNALAALRTAYEEAKDWRIRGAAVVGLGHLRHKDAVPLLIDALGDDASAIRQSAYEFLRRLAETTPEPDRSDWQDWWETNGPDYEFVDWEEVARKAQKYGYAPTRAGVYEGLDVIVLQSRGDHIEKLLAHLDIEHRITRGGQVSDAGVNPHAVFVSNCTGEINADDVQQLQWFVRTGGYLFCSCWALHHTAELVYPALPGRACPVGKLPTKGEVLDNVIAEAVPNDSPYLTGVFDDLVRPRYVLYGAHLIEVRDAEQVEVLIDSPDCASRWGGGNLAAWFDAGHGVILDSANHFDLQGLEKAPRLKSADDRKAYALDHMGLDYEQLREIDEQRLWGKASKVAKVARDLSAFRFITSFVREKRKQDQ